jgi:predicted secreted protein
MAISGRKTVIQVSIDGTQFNTVAELNEATATIEGDNQDITHFGDDFVRRIQGLKDTSYELSGFRSPSDTNGQEAILDALLNDTPLHVKFLGDGASGFQQEVKVASFEESSAVDGTVEVSIELEGTGPVTRVSAG